MKMKNSTILVSIVLLVLVVGGFVFMNSNTSNSNTATTPSTIISGETQKVVISEKNSNYYPDTITVKKGQPVEITLDNSVAGCLRSFTIRDLGVSKYAKTPSDKITFTPTQKGTFNFACSMGMGYGKIVVE